ncbi:MAG: ATP-binding protein [Gemmatimonadota bacterium]|nr:ATP-binding protein [Candidatus Palauibacter polyketidifaciens]
MAITREHDLSRVRLLLGEFPVVALLGARQVGKTTLARQLAAAYSEPVAWFDLEDPADLARLEDPGLELRPLAGLVVLDEVHRLPDIFQLLRVLADRPGPPARFLVLGSASPELLRQTSESLAGRVAFHELDGFGLAEVEDLERLWLRGGFPRSYLARSEPASRRWRDGFIRTLLARDLPELGSTIPSATLRRFWAMLAHWHGQIWNGAEFARAFGVSHATVRRYLDLLTSVFVVRQLQPWFENISRRQVRSPKVYIGDSGILHALLGLTNRTDVVSHPKVGASWEGFIIQQIAHLLRASPERCFHWSTHTGAELNLLVMDGARRYGFEVKRSEAPRLTRSMRSALETLNLDRLDIVHAGMRRYRLARRVRALPAAEIVSILYGDRDPAGPTSGLVGLAPASDSS